MTVLPSWAIVVVAVVFQATAPALVRLGDVARQLSEQDVADIERAVAPGGARPWLLNGPHGQVTDLQFIEAYLPPETATTELRRGSVISVVRGSASALAMIGIRPASPEATRQTWTVTGTFSYAQVAIADRDFDHVRGDEDVNRPFRVSGSFGDVELVSLVWFVRSSPSGPTPDARTTSGSVHGDWPIVTVIRQTDSIDVRLRRPGQDLSWESVKLRPLGPGWVVISISRVFA
jgi:hypothetical protein